MENITIGTQKYKVCAKRDLFGMFGKRKSSDIKDIYCSGIDDVYCNIEVYSSLKNNMNGSSIGPKLFIVDNRNPVDPKLISTNFYSVTYGAKAYIKDTTVDGESLTSTNSIGFTHVDQFRHWLKALIG